MPGKRVNYARDVATDWAESLALYCVSELSTGQQEERVWPKTNLLDWPPRLRRIVAPPSSADLL